MVNGGVLILVLMEDTLRECKTNQLFEWNLVLILVLMEDTLRGEFEEYVKQHLERLNPCFNGRYSQR